MTLRRLRILASLGLLALATGCAAPRTQATEPAASPAGTVDYSCKVDADCAVKNVGNCCGYYPVCVNKDSPTFPERVRQQCETEGMASICGFPEITGCACVEGRCTHLTGPKATPIEEER